MRILFTTFTYFPETSGVSIIVQTLAEGLAKKGNDVTVVTSNYGKSLLPEENYNNVKIYRKRFSINLFKKYIGDVNEYIDFVEKYPKDILVLECIQCYTTDILLQRLQNMKCKIVLHSHGGPGLHFKPFAWEGDFLHTLGHTHNWFRWRYYYKKILPSVARYIDVVICLSLCASDLSYMIKTMKRVEFLENAVSDIFLDSELSDKDTSTMLNLKNHDYILCVANYYKNKGQDIILKAFSNLRNKTCSLIMVGSKPTDFFHKINRQANIIMKTTGKEIVLLTGVDRYILPSLIRNAKFFVMASHHEEYPVSLIEAMACHTAFVCTDAGCSRLLPGGVTVAKIEDLPFIMEMLESHPEIRESFSNQGYQYVKEHNTIEIIVERFSKILESL